MGVSEPRELELLERDEHEARLRLDEHRATLARTDEGTPPEEHARLRKLEHELEHEWKRVADRLRKARQAHEH